MLKSQTAPPVVNEISDARLAEIEERFDTLAQLLLEPGLPASIASHLHDVVGTAQPVLWLAHETRRLRREIKAISALRAAGYQIEDAAEHEIVVLGTQLGWTERALSAALDVQFS